MQNGVPRTVNDTEAIRVDATETAVNPEYRCGATTIRVASARWVVMERRRSAWVAGSVGATAHEEHRQHTVAYRLAGRR
jgi:hypothetical protein